MRWKIIEKNKFVGWGWLKEKLSFFSSQITVLGATTRNFNPPLEPETSGFDGHFGPSVFDDHFCAFCFYTMVHRLFTAF